MAGTKQTSARLRTLPAGALACALALALGLLGAGEAPAKNNGAIQAQDGCPAQPVGLAPEGPGPTRFTMLIRINQQVNVDTYANFNSATGGLGGYVRPQDIFVINTRFKTTTPAVAAQLATNLRAAFPCNRIIGLNGLSLNPVAPGYAFSLLDHPSVFALVSDFEPMDWNGGRPTDPGRARWNKKYRVAYKRIKVWNRRLAATLAANPLGAAKRSGLVPIDYPSWNYGQIAQDLDKKNRRLGGRHLGPQSVQTQDSCADRGVSGFRARVKAVQDQYRYKLVRKTVKRKGKKRKITVRRKLKPKARPKLSNLSVQISFSDTPNPNAGMAITKTSAARAAACARAGLKRGAGAFFFFASDDSMRLLFQRPEIAGLRPPTS
jgi:hypothetical protein